jgi:hypothetical protein
MHVPSQLSSWAPYGVLAVHGRVARHSMPICNVSVIFADFADFAEFRRFRRRGFASPEALEFRPEPCTEPVADHLRQMSA